MPSVWPWRSSKLTPSTARTSPIWRRNTAPLVSVKVLTRSSTRSTTGASGSATASGGAVETPYTSAAERPATSSVRMHAAAWSGPTDTSSGSAVRQSSIASGQRGANGQPGGSAAIDGGAPGIGTSREPWAASRRGTEPSSPTVYGMTRGSDQIGHRRRLDRPARVHHQRAVGELGHHPEVVGDDQHACAGDVARGPQHVEDLRLDRDVERGRRLVADDQVGIVGDRDGDDDALPLAAGQFVRERPGAPLRLGDPDQFEQFDGARPGRPAAQSALVHPQRLGDLVADGVDGGQRRHRILEHRADDAAPDARHPLVVQTDELVAVQPHRSGHLAYSGKQSDHRHRASPTCLHRIRRPARRPRAGGRRGHPAHRGHPFGVGGGLRVTAARVAFLETVRGGDHLDVEGVAAGVRDRIGHVSLQAVYEALHALTAVGLIRRIEPAGGRPDSRGASAIIITTSCAGRAASSLTSTARSARPRA